MTRTTKSQSPTNRNLRHWEALCTTDPASTKPFTRAGGFRGTAIKPIWTTMRMTEHFGPCGIGWGMGKPEFELVPAGDELLIFCTVRLWYREMISPSAEHEAAVYGVGGDKVIAKQQRGLVTDDEAYKKAYTDALSNAMKHIGVSADVHMGRFDDSKYVAAVRAEYTPAETPSEAPQRAARTTLADQAHEEAAKGDDALRAFWGGLENREKLSICKALRADPALGCPTTLKLIAQKASEAARIRRELVEQAAPVNELEEMLTP